MDLQDTTTSGLFVEFLDAFGNSAGTAVYFNIDHRRIPAVGDRVMSRVRSPRSDRVRVLTGVVKQRTFDLQRNDEGRACMWVRLTVQVIDFTAKTRRRAYTGPVMFSRN